MKHHKIASLVYNTLLMTRRYCKYRRFKRFWEKAWAKSCQKFSGPVCTTLHGYQVLLNYGHRYPLIVRSFPSFNNPIVELVFQIYIKKGGAITLVDIGANIGDTILLLQSSCPNMIGEFYCIDGDKEFIRYLRHNIGTLPGAHILPYALSAHEDVIGTPHRGYGGAGTASFVGKPQIQAYSLDTLLQKDLPTSPIDIIKSDVDGYDGQVLLGSRQILERYHPMVLFEWHPRLCQQAEKNWSDHFTALESCGYTVFLWFTKYGDFSHFMHGFDRESVDICAQFCLHTHSLHDWHYDIIALPQTSTIAALDLADLTYARKYKMRT